ncbi:hypothetical protein [Sinorhizobium fredii]|uniref:hypothetical protein n=1 Tax=Rhizobium fredii TaxID=380 RepID=UPI00056B99AF|nr:hypothetical protein [Sinorhizobium fredii]
MTRQEIIAELESITEPKRLLDQAIAVLFKYRREKITVPAEGNRPERMKVVWYGPKGEQVGPVPNFTESIDAAKSLFDYARPNTAAGYSYHDGYAKAAVGDGEAVIAFNPATALCLATIKAVPESDPTIHRSN